MKLQWWDAAHSKIICELEAGENFLGLTGPGSFQITGPDIEAVEKMDPAPDIEDAPAGDDADKAPAKEPKKAEKEKDDDKGHGSHAAHKK